MKTKIITKLLLCALPAACIQHGYAMEQYAKDNPPQKQSNNNNYNNLNESKEQIAVNLETKFLDQCKTHLHKVLMQNALSTNLQNSKYASKYTETYAKDEGKEKQVASNIEWIASEMVDASNHQGAFDPNNMECQLVRIEVSNDNKSPEQGDSTPVWLNWSQLDQLTPQQMRKLIMRNVLRYPAFDVYDNSGSRSIPSVGDLGQMLEAVKTALTNAWLEANGICNDDTEDIQQKLGNRINQLNTLLSNAKKTVRSHIKQLNLLDVGLDTDKISEIYQFEEVSSPNDYGSLFQTKITTGLGEDCEITFYGDAQTGDLCEVHTDIYTSDNCVHGVELIGTVLSRATLESNRLLLGDMRSIVMQLKPEIMNDVCQEFKITDPLTQQIMNAFHTALLMMYQSPSYRTLVSRIFHEIKRKGLDKLDKVEQNDNLSQSLQILLDIGGNYNWLAVYNQDGDTECAELQKKWISMLANMSLCALKNEGPEIWSKGGVFDYIRAWNQLSGLFNGFCRENGIDQNVSTISNTDMNDATVSSLITVSPNTFPEFHFKKLSDSNKTVKLGDTLLVADDPIIVSDRAKTKGRTRANPADKQQLPSQQWINGERYALIGYLQAPDYQNGLLSDEQVLEPFKTAQMHFLNKWEIYKVGKNWMASGVLGLYEKISCLGLKWVNDEENENHDNDNNSEKDNHSEKTTTIKRIDNNERDTQNEFNPDNLVID